MQLLLELLLFTRGDLFSFLFFFGSFNVQYGSVRYFQLLTFYRLMLSGLGVSCPNGLSNPKRLSSAVLRSAPATCAMEQIGQQQAALKSTIQGSLGNPMSARVFAREPAMRQGAAKKKAGTQRPPQSFLSSTKRSLQANR